MTTKKQQEQMLEYLVSKLNNGHDKVLPRHMEVVQGITSNYILIDSNGIVLVVDKEYPNDSFDELYRKAIKAKQNVGVVFYKGADTFFRPASPRHHYKKKGLSMKNYSEEEMRKMIMFRPEEVFIYNERGPRLQYYQPESERLQEGVVDYRFGKVKADYSHIDSRYRFRPQNTALVRDHIINDERFYDGDFKLENGLLVPLHA